MKLRITHSQRADRATDVRFTAKCSLELDDAERAIGEQYGYGPVLRFAEELRKSTEPAKLMQIQMQLLHGELVLENANLDLLNEVIGRLDAAVRSLPAYWQRAAARNGTTEVREVA